MVQLLGGTSVYYRGEKTTSVSLLQIRVKNSGNQPILEDDYSEPLSFSFSPNTRLADVAITASEPPNIKMAISQTSGYKAESTPGLLNPDDVVTIRFVVIGASNEDLVEDFQVGGRIAGVGKIEISSSKQRFPAAELIAAMVGVVVASAMNFLIAGPVRRLVGRALGALREKSIREKSQSIFRDTFSDFAGWQLLGEGMVSHSKEQQYIGAYSLKKSDHGDPNGGFRKIKETGENIDRGFVFSGRIYSPSVRDAGPADRLAIEDSNNNGYGFNVNLTAKRVVIERRDNGIYGQLMKAENLELLQDQWYKFEFYVRTDGRLILWIADSSGKRIKKLSTSNDQYSMFDRIAVRGGAPYYVDDLSIDPIETEADA